MFPQEVSSHGVHTDPNLIPAGSESRCCPLARGKQEMQRTTVDLFSQCYINNSRSGPNNWNGCNIYDCVDGILIQILDAPIFRIVIPENGTELRVVLKTQLGQQQPKYVLVHVARKPYSPGAQTESKTPARPCIE